MRLLGFGCAILIACGGTTTSVDGGGTDSGGNDSGGSDSGSTDSGGSDVVQVDAAECVPPGGTCANPCPAGTICLKASGPLETDLGCTTIPPQCNGTATCACMKDCFCSGGIDQCVDGTTYLMCNNGAISRRTYKKDIDYVSDGEREELASHALSTPIESWREPASSVELYGRASELLATVQQQQRQIDALKRQVDALSRKR